MTIMARIFISHSHHDREIAGEIKKRLASYGASVFVAHDDIRPTQEWQDAIIDNLKTCDAFLALLTDRFGDSDWTDQETGIAVALDKVIIPIKIDLDPYGFIGKYQALRWSSDKDESFKTLIRTLVEKNLINADNVIDGFTNSHSFRNAEFNLDLVTAMPGFSKAQINKIASGAVLNNQIWNATGAKPILNEFFAKYSSTIDPEVMSQWKKLVEQK
jgi:hypothetical protein